MIRFPKFRRVEKSKVRLLSQGTRSCNGVSKFGTGLSNRGLKFRGKIDEFDTFESSGPKKLSRSEEIDFAEQITEYNYRENWYT